MGMRVAGLSILANVAPDVSSEPVTHSEVLETAGQLNADVLMLFQRFFDTYES
jgi:purine nucleoside phosphorylase